MSKYHVTRKETLIPTLGQALDNIGTSYVLFLNSASKKEKIEMLANIRAAAKDAHVNSKKLLGTLSSFFRVPDPTINTGLTKAVDNVTGDNIHQQILNLDHLYKRFMLESNPQTQFQYLFQIYKLSDRIAETAKTTIAEPDEGTERA